MNPLFIFITIAGYIIGLGAVTVIDLHGFLGRTSKYWTEATTRTHKVTKPMIWVGTLLAFVGGLLFYYSEYLVGMIKLHIFIFVILVLNGLFLSLVISPLLLRREKEGKQAEILSASWQRKITASFIVSFVGWWGSLVLFVLTLTNLNL
jgi:hypothetical protein